MKLPPGDTKTDPLLNGGEMTRVSDAFSTAGTAGKERMETPEDVAVMLRLSELGWGQGNRVNERVTKG